jgi:hypothetical protein
MMRISSEGDGGCCCCTFEGLAGVDGGTMATRRSAGRGDGKRTNSPRAEMARASKRCVGDARAATAA